MFSKGFPGYSRFRHFAKNPEFADKKFIFDLKIVIFDLKIVIFDQFWIVNKQIHR